MPQCLGSKPIALGLGLGLGPPSCNGLGAAAGPTQPGGAQTWGLGHQGLLGPNGYETETEILRFSGETKGETTGIAVNDISAYWAEIFGFFFPVEAGGHDLGLPQ